MYKKGGVSAKERGRSAKEGGGSVMRRAASVEKGPSSLPRNQKWSASIFVPGDDIVFEMRLQRNESYTSGHIQELNRRSLKVMVSYQYTCEFVCPVKEFDDEIALCKQVKPIDKFSDEALSLQVPNESVTGWTSNTYAVKESTTEIDKTL